MGNWNIKRHPLNPHLHKSQTVRLLRTSVKYKVKHGHLPVWVAVNFPCVTNVPLREVLRWCPPWSLSKKQIDWIVEKDLGAFNPNCGDLTPRQKQALFLALPNAAKYPEPKES